MVTLVAIHPQGVPVSASYVSTGEAYDITSAYLSDDSRPHEIDRATMLWLDEEGFFCEIESIYPPQVEVAPCSYSKSLVRQEGFPQLQENVLHGNVVVQRDNDGFILWLEKGLTVNKIIQCENDQFLFSDNILAGISAYHAEIEK